MTSTLSAAAPIALVLLATLSLVWVGFDARKRGRSSMRIVLLCFLTWPFGFVIWRGIRPPPALK